MAQDSTKDGRRDEGPAGQPGTEKGPDDSPEAEQAKGGSPAAGPHATRDLTNPDATPGAGALPGDKQDGEADAGTG